MNADQKPQAEHPEAWALGPLDWQFFVTLTFAEPDRARFDRMRPMYAFLRKVAGMKPASEFRKLLWCARWEKNTPDGLGHYHLCVGGVNPEKLSTQACQKLVEWWRSRLGALADVQLYDHALDGISYVLKEPMAPGICSQWAAVSHKMEFDEFQPTLSESIRRLCR